MLLHVVDAAHVIGTEIKEEQEPTELLRMSHFLEFLPMGMYDKLSPDKKRASN